MLDVITKEYLNKITRLAVHGNMPVYNVSDKEFVKFIEHEKRVSFYEGDGVFDLRHIKNDSPLVILYNWSFQHITISGLYGKYFGNAYGKAVKETNSLLLTSFHVYGMGVDRFCDLKDCESGIMIDLDKELKSSFYKHVRDDDKAVYSFIKSGIAFTIGEEELNEVIRVVRLMKQYFHEGKYN